MYGAIDLDHNSKVFNKRSFVLGSVLAAGLLLTLGVFYASDTEQKTLLSSDSCLDGEDYSELDYCASDSRPVAFGYDIVSYFTTKTATLGSSDYQSEYEKYIYYFSSQENLELFESDPTFYIPQYGGYCAYGVSYEIDDLSGLSTRESSPSYFLVYKNQLFLFRAQAAMLLFHKNLKEYQPMGDEKWETWFGADCSGPKFTGCSDDFDTDGNYVPIE